MEPCDLQLLSAYLDGELAPAQRLQIEGHLRACAECRAELDALTAAMDLIDADEFPALTSRELNEAYVRIEQRIDAAGEERRLFRLSLLVCGLAASILVVSVAWLQETTARQPGRPSSVVSAPADWERIAVTLLPDAPDDPIENPADQRIRLANAEPFANWMVKALERE